MTLARNQNTSFTLIVLISAIFFAGYFLLKCPLAFILHRQHIPLLQAYSITTTANILMAIVSVILGVLLKNNTNQKFLLFQGVLLSTIALILLKTSHVGMLLLGVSFYVLGGSLYFFNIIIYINKLLLNHKESQAGNYRYQIWINAGGFIGAVLFIMEYNNHLLLNQYSVFACVASLVLFVGCYPKLVDAKLFFKKTCLLQAKLLGVLGLIFLCLYEDLATRWMAFIAFILAAGYGLYHAQKTHNYNYLALILLVLFFSVPYWLGYTILYNEFFHLLDKNTYLFFGMPSNVIILLNPLVNIVFGSFVLKQYQKRTTTMQTDLFIGMILLVVAFLSLFIGLFLASSPQALLFVFPITAVLFFSCGEFLIQTTLNASVKTLLNNQENISFGMGVLRSSRACASALGYFFMWLTVRDGLVQQDIISHKEPRLYLLTACYILLSLVVYFGVKRVLRLHVQ